MFDLLDIACAAMAALELEKISEKEHAFKHVNRVYGYMTPPARAEYQEWVERKGWKQNRSSPTAAQAGLDEPCRLVGISHQLG